MSHLACADRPEHPLNDQQIRQFREIRSLFRGIAQFARQLLRHLPRRVDLLRRGSSRHRALRRQPDAGQAQSDAAGDRLEGAHSPGAQSAKGAAVGYGATWTAKRDSRIAIVAAGYADGIARAAAITEGTKPREVLVAGKRCRMVGRVSMDLMALDVTDLPASAVRRDQMVTLIGEGLSLDEVAAQAGTISYEVLTSLGRRFHRVWKA